MAKKEATFKLNVDSGDSINDLKQFEKELSNVNDDFVEVSSNISEMEDQLYSMALAGDTTSKEFKELQAQTAKYKQIVIETDRSIDALAEQGRGLSTALSLAEGTVAGIQAYTGVTALLGAENEELIATITKLQAAQGVLNSIQIIRQQLQENSIKLTQAQTAAQKLLTLATGKGTKAMKLLRGALLATGIGALVVGVALLAANWDKVKIALGGATKSQQAMNDVTDKAIEAAAEELSALDKLGKKINDENVSRADKTEAIKELQAQYPSLLSNVDAEGSSLDEVNKALELNAQLTLLKAQADAIAELQTEEFKNQIKAQTDAQAGSNQGWVAGAIGVFNHTAAIGLNISEQKKSYDESVKRESILDDLLAGIQNQIKATKELGASDDNIETKRTAHAAAQKSRLDRMRAQEEELNNARRMWAAEQDALLDAIALAEEEATTTAIQKELNAVNDKYFELITRAEEFGLNSEILAEEQARKILEIENKYAAESYANKVRLEEAKASAVREGIGLQLDAMIEGQAKEEAVLRQGYEDRRLAIQESEILAFEEKLPLILALEEQEQIAIQEVRDKYREQEKAKESEMQQSKMEGVNNYLNAATEMLSLIADIQQLTTDKQLNSIDEEYDAKLKAAEGDAKLTAKLEEEKDAKKTAVERAAFERSKKMQIAMAIITGIQGVMAAFTAGSSMGPAGVVLGPLMAALAAAGTIVNIAKIKATKFEGGGSTGGAGGAYGSGGVPTGASAASLSVSDNLSNEQTNLNPDGTVAQEAQQTVQVVVVETDITDSQNAVNQIEVKSTY